MGEVKKLFGDAPEPPREKPRALSMRDVVDMKYADISRGLEAAPAEARFVQVELGAYAFLVTQGSLSRKALKDVELGLQWVREKFVKLDFAAFEAWLTETEAYVAQALSVDETTIGLTPETVPEEIENEHVDLPLCPGCGKPPSPCITADFHCDIAKPMFADHAFTRKEVALCADRNRPRSKP